MKVVYLNTITLTFQVENALSTYMPDAMVIVYSVVSSESFHVAEEILQYLWRSGSSSEKAVILVGNKADLVRTRTVTIVGERLFFFIFTHHIFPESHTWILKWTVNK